MAAGKNLELARLQFENDRGWNPWFFPPGRPKLLCQAPDHGFGFGQRHILLERILDRDRLCGSVRHDFALVNTTRQPVQAQTIAPEVRFEPGQLERSQIPNSLYSELRKFFFSDSTHSGHAPDRQWQKKPVYSIGLNDKEPIWFAPVRRKLC